MNCIFICIFNQPKYIDMFYLLLESIYIYGKIDKNTQILIYTSTPFMDIIKNSHLFNENMVFEINDTYNTIDLACKARMDLFKLASCIKYDKILYLDTGILIKDDLNKIFDLIKDDILYVLEEGNEIDNLLNDPYDFWGGKTLFSNEEKDNLKINGEIMPFTSGILLFNNCKNISNLFENINKHIIDNPHNFCCYDQPYIVYNAFKYNLYDNKILKNYACDNENYIHSNKIIHHFSEGIGNSQHKITIMKHFLDNLKDYTICNNITKTKYYIDLYLLPIIQNCGEYLEGNIFMLHQTTTYSDVYLNKAKNISNLLLNKNIKNVMEIGFNSGFSALLMLITNPNIKIICFDLGEHTYTMPCYKQIKKTFGDRINLIIGDSTKTLENINDNYDLIHIDGGHTTDVATSDIIQSYRLSKNKTILIMDDYDFPNLHELWDIYINKYDLKHININLYNSIHHDIKYVLK